MKCPECGKGEIEMRVDAYVYYKVAEDGSIDYREVARTETFDDRDAICDDCGTMFAVEGGKVLPRKSAFQEHQ